MKKNNRLQIALVAGIILAVLFSGIFLINNRSLKKDLRTEKITSEALLSEKMSLDKSLEKIKGELSTEKGKNANLDKKINEISSQIEAKENELKKIKAENYSLRPFKAKVKELEASILGLNNELNTLKTERDNLILENQSLITKLASVQNDYEKVVSNSIILKAMASNNHRVEAVRGKNDKHTIRAKRTQKLIFSFDLPSDTGNSISFKLKCPENKVYDSKDNKSASIKITKSDRNFFENNQVLEKTETKNIELMFIPEERLKGGEYEFMVYNDGSYIGSSKLSLR